MANCWQVPPIKFNLYPNRWRRHSLPFHLDADTVDFHALDNHPNQDRQGPGARGPASSNFVRAERFFLQHFLFLHSMMESRQQIESLRRLLSKRNMLEHSVSPCSFFFFFYFSFRLFFPLSVVMRVINRGEGDLTLRDERI